ncbi:DnaJ C-terminal domain-containing protein [Reinekea sp.]|jgi:curved DNA-binding protein|uniref:DnaJ C-terminal domain-containing protein n=1 Tax=Reinekea sp. TaxID=1970455 RepID=UPI0039894D7F
MEFKDYYQILGVSSDADGKAIKAAYRKLAQKYHPDMNQDEGAEDKFKEVAEAYQVLKSDSRRAEFDELRKYGRQSKSGFTPPPGWQPKQGSGFQGSSAADADFSDFFNSIFGSGQGFSGANFREPQSTRGQDVELELPIFLEETLAAFKKVVEYTLNVQENGLIKPLKKHLNVTIPQGVADGQRIRLAGQGGPGTNKGAAGDLYLHVRLVPHPMFDVSGHDLLITVPVAPWESALGTKVTVPTLTGKISLTIPPNTQTGKRFRIKGRGLKTRSITGDLYAIVKVVMPDKASVKAAEHWQALANSENFNPRTDWEVSS